MQEPNRGISLDESAAYGAAIQGAVLSGADQFSDVLLMDVNPNTIWFKTVSKTLKELIPRNVHMPYLKRHKCITAKDDQTSMGIDIYEEEGTTAKDNLFLGSLSVTDIPKLKTGSLIVEVLFEIDANSILTVYEQERDFNLKIKVHKKIRGLFPDEIEKMKIDAEKFAENDKRVKELLMLKMISKDLRIHSKI